MYRWTVLCLEYAAVRWCIAVVVNVLVLIKNMNSDRMPVPFVQVRVHTCMCDNLWTGKLSLYVTIDPG